MRTQCSATVRWWERQWTSSVSRGIGARLQPRPAGGTSSECREGGGLWTCPGAAEPALTGPVLLAMRSRTQVSPTYTGHVWT